MPDQQAEANGTFVWYELMTTDTAAAKAFYSSVVGWTTTTFPGMDYTIWHAAPGMGGGVGGLMAIPPEAQGMPPVWLGYISVDDVDAYAKKVTEAGGSIKKEPADIPSVGRFAVAADPQGAAFLLFKPNPPETMPERPAPGSPGTIGWHELMSADGAAGFEFYSKLFGWVKSATHDMGPMGIYQIFAYSEGGAPVGGMMTKPAEVPVSSWNYYFNVDGIQSAALRVENAGGKVCMGPHQVPGDSWIVAGLDPQGASFCLVSTKA